MAVNFPSNPTNNQLFTANGKNYKYNSTDSVWNLVPVTEVTDVSDLTDTTGLLVSRIEMLADMAALIAKTGMAAGDQAFVQSNNSLYIYTGTGWYKIATVENLAPVAITGVDASYVLATDGTPTVVTATSSDPEGFPLTWSYAVTSGSLGTTATVSQADNVFTITPGTTDPDDVGTFELTFSVTDGSTGAVSVSSTFSLSFYTVHQFANNTYDRSDNFLLSTSYTDQGNSIYEVSDSTGAVWKIWANFGDATTAKRWDGHALIRDQLSHTANDWEQFGTTSQGSFPTLPTPGNFKTDGSYLHSNSGAGPYATAWYHDTSTANQAWQSIKSNAYANRGSNNANGAYGGIVAAKPPTGAKEIMWVWGDEHSDVACYVARYDTVDQAITYMVVRGLTSSAINGPNATGHNYTILEVDDDDVIFAGELGGTVPFVMFCLYR